MLLGRSWRSLNVDELSRAAHAITLTSWQLDRRYWRNDGEVVRYDDVLLVSIQLQLQLQWGYL